MMKKLMATFVCLATLAISALAADTNTVAAASDEAWVVSLGGVGSTATTGNTTTAFGVDLSVGRTGHLLLPIEVGVRQSVAWSSDDSGVYSTRLYSDWTVLSVAQKTLDVFVGANVGITYGDVQSFWNASPEAGLRWWVKKDVAILGRAEFPFRISDEAKFTDTVAYFVGFQVRW